MNPPSSESDDVASDAIRDAASRWVVRQDRRLSPAEAAELASWLAADPLHAAAFERTAASWRMFRQLGSAVRHAEMPEPVRQGRRNWVVATSIAAALAVGFFSVNRGRMGQGATDAAGSRPPAIAAAPTTRTLGDGSVARLKAGTEIVEEFSGSERRVRLLRGAAFFSVVRDSARPFLVEASGTTVRAVGTAFSVDAQRAEIDILVAQGTVQVTSPATFRAETRQASEFVVAGHRVVVAREAAPRTAPIVVTPVSAQEIARRLAWSAPILELAGSTLSELVAAFRERTGRRIEIDGPALAAMRIGGQFPTDDVDGFVRAIAALHAIKVEHHSDGSVMLRAP